MVRDISDLRERAVGSLEHFAAVRAKVDARGSEFSVGDLFVFEGSAALGIEWALISQVLACSSERDGLWWFVVPLDQNSMVGTWDVPVSGSSEGGPGTLRCGCGIWLHESDFMVGSRSGFLEERCVDEVSGRLAELVNPECVPAKIRADVDSDVDYEEWICEVRMAAECLEARLKTGRGGEV